MSDTLNNQELRHMIWTGLGKRTPPNFPRDKMLDVVAMGPSRVPLSPVDTLRNELADFIETNRNNLSLPCHGRCREHGDLIVLLCHKQFLGSNNTED